MEVRVVDSVEVSLARQVQLKDEFKVVEELV